MTNYNATLAQEYATIRSKVKRGMLPLVARCPAIEKAVGDYAVAHADYFDTALANGKNPPINYKDSDALDKYADLVMYEELTWSHPDKMSIVEYPIMSDDQEALRNGKYTPNSDLQYGDRRFTGRHKTHFTDDDGSLQVRNSRVVEPSDPTIEAVSDYVDLYDALANAGLSARQREAIDLVYFGNNGDGMSQEDAAQAMGVSQPAIAKFQRVALSKLHEYMTKV